MEPPPVRECPNCKKEVPKINFQLHSIYCAKNLKICQQCKEPVAITNMEKHMAQVPCPQCGEVMQACDIPSHKTDACSMTQVQCSYCELQLERSNMGEHELYCGSRTEACPDCKELVMFKYKKLHEESNHGFLKLDDEPGPIPSWKVQPKIRNTVSKGSTENHIQKNFKSANVDKKNSTFSNLKNSSNIVATSSNIETSSIGPQVSTSRGAIKKRIAPQPPTKQSVKEVSFSNRNPDLVPMYKAMERDQVVRRNRESQNQILREQGLPPILTTAEKVDKLKKMSNKEVEDTIIKKHQEKKHEKKTNANHDEKKPKRLNEWPEFFEFSHTDNQLKPITRYEFEEPEMNGINNGSSLHKINIDNDDQRDADKSKTSSRKKHPVEYFDYDHENDVLKDVPIPEPVDRVDRFTDIKNNLQALRKELKNCRSPLEVKKPTNIKENREPSKNRASPKTRIVSDNLDLFKISGEVASPPPINYINSNLYEDSLQNVMLPCEFCNEMIGANFLVVHETGCRPQITSFSELVLKSDTGVKNKNSDNPVSIKNVNQNNNIDKINFKNKVVGKNKKEVNSRNKPMLPLDLEFDDPDEVKLPCEFCMSLIPACRLTWHQETCVRA